MIRARQAVAVVISLLLLAMAVIAGRSERLFGTWDIVVHGVLGNILFTLALVAALLAFLGRAGRTTKALAVVFAVLAFAQVGLGYVGRDTLDAAAWHIPNGVLLMGLAGFILADTRRAAERPAD